ncbi:MAG: TlpA family protein disulfide reductase [Marinifilaceae bacterium]
MKSKQFCITASTMIIMFMSMSLTLFSQKTSNKIIYNKDGSISVVSDSAFYTDSNGNRINFAAFQDSLNMGDYSISLMESSNGVETKLVRKNATETIFKVGEKFPVLTYGNKRQNKIINKKGCKVVTFWSTTCKPCVEELIELNRVAPEYRGVNFIAVTKMSNESVRKFFKDKGLELNNLTFITDYPYGKETGIVAFPYNVLTDHMDVVQKVVIGSRINNIYSYLNDKKNKSGNK